MSGVLDTLKAATPSRRSVTICTDGALQAEYDALAEGLDDAAKKDAKASSLAMRHTTQQVDQMETVRERMAGSNVTFLFETMDWKDRIALQAGHPPRDGVVADRFKGFNIATYYPELIKGSCIAVSGADGDTASEIPPEVWVGLFGDDETKGSLNLGAVNTLCQTAEAVNDREASVPPSARSLLGNRDSGASLAQPSPGESAPSVSADGNPPSSPSTRTTPKTRKRKATTPPSPGESAAS